MENSKYHTSVLFFKKAALTWNLLFCFFNSHAQTFSLRASLPISSQYQMVRVTDYGYLVVGEGQDTLPNFHLPMYILGYDYYGELLFQKEYFSNNDLTNPLLDTDINLNDSIVTFATSFLEQENDTLYARLHWVNPTGDTLFTSNYKSPYYYSSNDPQNISYWMLPTSITKSDDNLYIYLVCQIADYPPIQNSFILLKLTAEGEVVWTYHHRFNDNYYACDAVCFHNGNPWRGAAGWGGGANYNKLLEIDNISGVLLQEIELIPNGNLLNNLSEMIMQDDGVVVSCIRMTEGAVSNPAIYKMDYFGNYMWSTEIPNGENVEQYNDHLVQTQDGGFVCAAVHFEGGPTVGVPDEYNYVYRTWLWKVDANGNFLWDRKYEYLSLDSAYYNVYAYPHDLKATPDGGFIIAGEATATCSNFPDCTEATQQGWLLKVDGCGCLVPGCDPGCIVGVEEIAAEDEIKYFRFGPNPVSDMLNLYIPSLSIPMNELNFSLYDNLGRKVNDFQFKFDDTTYMIDASNLASGEYILLLSQNGQIVQTEKVVKN